MNDEDEVRVRHMLDAAREAILFSDGRTGEDLNRDRMFLLSVVKEIEIIGEAASRLSTEARAAMPEVPWRDVIGMRNRLTHGYFDWDTKRIWTTVVSDLPDLVHRLEEALSRLG
jgi:uncharacterized protein with HEPN domain